MPEVKDDGGQFASNPRGRMLTSCAPLRSNWPHPFPEFLLNFILPQHVFVYVFAHAWQADVVSVRSVFNLSEGVDISRIK